MLVFWCGSVELGPGTDDKACGMGGFTEDAPDMRLPTLGPAVEDALGVVRVMGRAGWRERCWLADGVAEPGDGPLIGSGTGRFLALDAVPAGDGSAIGS